MAEYAGLHGLLRRVTVGLLLVLVAIPCVRASDFQTFEGCRLIETDWADGDSFLVTFPDGREIGLRIYGADTLETRISDSTLARRLRAQRRYFGISEYGGSAATSIDLAKQLGAAATARTAELLSEPFTVHTTFADGQGSARYRRVYAFVTTHDGKDLAAQLVREGLARAFGVYRSTPDGRHRDEYRAALQDGEFVAARKGLGVWAYTDWEKLPNERLAQRLEEAEEAIAMGEARLLGPISINRASPDELAALPGIGPALAARIVAARPFQTVEDLQKVPGIGAKTYAALADQIEL